MTVKQITQETLVPLGTVAALILMSVSVMNLFGKDRERVIVIDTRVKQLESSQNELEIRVEKIKLATASADNSIKDTLQKLHEDVLLIKFRLGIMEGQSVQPMTNMGPGDKL